MNIKNRNNQLEEAGVNPLGASAETSTCRGTDTSFRGFQTTFWGDGTWDYWLSKHDKQLAFLLKSLTGKESGYYAVKRLEIQNQIVLVHRAGGITDLFMLNVSKNEQAGLK